MSIDWATILISNAISITATVMITLRVQKFRKRDRFNVSYKDKNMTFNMEGEGTKSVNLEEITKQLLGTDK